MNSIIEKKHKVNRKKTVTIIIVTFNSSKFIDACLKTVLNDHPIKYKRKIIVVDNASIDDTRKIIRSKYDRDVTLIVNKNNNGFARGANQGIRKNRKSDYFLLINPDSKLNEGAIAKMISGLTQNRAGICGGRTVGFENEKLGDHFRKINILTGIFDFTNLRKIYPNDYWHKYFYFDDDTDNKTCSMVDAVTGGFMMITRDTVKAVGYFDDKFFMYLEDMDYCLRARNAGIDIVFCPQAEIKHYGGGSSNNKTRSNSAAWVNSRRYFFLKHFNFLTNLVIQPIFIIDNILITYIGRRNS